MTQSVQPISAKLTRSVSRQQCVVLAEQSLRVLRRVRLCRRPILKPTCKSRVKQGEIAPQAQKLFQTHHVCNSIKPESWFLRGTYFMALVKERSVVCSVTEDGVHPFEKDSLPPSSPRHRAGWISPVFLCTELTQQKQDLENGLCPPEDDVDSVLVVVGDGNGFGVHLTRGAGNPQSVVRARSPQPPSHEVPHIELDPAALDLRLVAERPRFVSVRDVVVSGNRISSFTFHSRWQIHSRCCQVPVPVQFQEPHNWNQTIFEFKEKINILRGNWSCESTSAKQNHLQIFYPVIPGVSGEALREGIGVSNCNVCGNVSCPRCPHPCL